MQWLRRERMQALDRLAIETHGVPGSALMRRAGRGVAQAARRLLRGPFAGAPVRVLCGRGNNGGDGFVAAEALRGAGHPVEVWLAGAPDALRGDALEAFAAMRAAGVPWRAMPGADEWTDPARNRDPLGGLVIDALLGTGARGAPQGVIAAAIAWTRAAAGVHRILAVDIPSGLDADRGEAPGAVVCADMTVTLGAPKIGMRAPASRPYCGRIEVLDIGLPPLPPGWGEAGPELIAAPELRDRLPRRNPDDHKGCFGHVLIVGGAPGFGGAPALAALGALRAGAGRVSALAPVHAAAALASAAPEVMTHAWNGEDGGPGGFGPDVWRRWRPDPFPFDVVVAGPGLGNRPSIRALIEDILAEPVPMVLDADALNVLAGRPAALQTTAAARVLTPHPGEAARLLDCETAAIRREPVAAAETLARTCRAVVVLKGGVTCVAAPGAPTALNFTGNPGMATGGAGDVLAGIIGALMAQGLAARDAACLGVYLHATAGDTAAWKTGRHALCARDLVDGLGEAFLTLTPR